MPRSRSCLVCSVIDTLTENSRRLGMSGIPELESEPLSSRSKPTRSIESALADLTQGVGELEANCGPRLQVRLPPGAWQTFQCIPDARDQPVLIRELTGIAAGPWNQSPGQITCGDLIWKSA